MNIRKYILIICALSLFAACDHDNEKLVYESDTNNYFSFQIDKLNKELEKTENLLNIPVYREGTQGQASITARLLFQQNPDGTEAPGRDFISLEDEVVTFKEGQNCTNIKLKIDLSKLDYLTKAKANIGIGAGESTALSTFGKSSLVLSLSRKPTWVEFEEKGIYTSQFLGTSKEVTILKAEEAPFYIIKDCYVKNGDIRVDLDKNGIATIEQQRAFLHAEYGTGYAIGTGYLDADRKTVIMQIQFLVDLNGQWGIVSGTAFEESFTIPER